jgi:hypothetical protein
MRDSASMVDAEERWVDHETDYPEGFRVLRLAMLVCFIGPWLGIGLLLIILRYEFSTQQSLAIFGLMAVWFFITLPLALIVRLWQRQIDRAEHLRLLHPQDTPRSILVSDPELRMRGTLLDPSRKRYVIKLSSWWAGNIYDEYGRTIGRGVRSNGMGGRMHSVHEIDGTPIVLIQRGVPDLNRRPTDTHDITDGEDYLLGTVKSRGKRPIAMVLVAPAAEDEAEDGEDHEVLVALENNYWSLFKSSSFGIYDDRSGERVADFNPYDVPPETSGERHGKTWNRIFGHSIYSLHVLDPSYDRRTLIGLAVCVSRVQEIRRRND